MEFSKVTYRPVDESYFEARRLERQGGQWSLLCLGVGTVIVGEFSGWSPGLLLGGLGGLLVATLLITVMYVAFCMSQAELATMMPFAGAGYAYARAGLGPAWGAFTAYTQIICYIVLSAVVCIDVTHYLGPVVGVVLGGITIPEPVMWLVIFAVFVAINVHGARLTFIIVIATTIAAVVVLVGFLVSLRGGFSLVNALEIARDVDGSGWLPNGFSGIAWSIPFAIWFYVGIEALPLAAEESERPRRHMPRALVGGIAIIIVLALATLFLNSGASAGANAVGLSPEPLLHAVKVSLSGLGMPILLKFLATSGGIASFHAIIYVYGRAIYAASRAAYVPPWLSVTDPVRRTPRRALVVGGIVGYLITLAIDLSPDGVLLDEILINMATFAALTSCAVQMVAYLVLARDYPSLPRPYRSAAGPTGAMTALLTAVVALVLMFFNPTLRPGLYGLATALLVGMAYFFAYARHRLVETPEEAYAVRAIAHIDDGRGESETPRELSSDQSGGGRPATAATFPAPLPPDGGGGG